MKDEQRRYNLDDSQMDASFYDWLNSGYQSKKHKCKSESGKFNFEKAELVISTYTYV